MKAQDRVWVCIVCGYVHRGPEPPETCPLCGASSEDFEASAPVSEAASKPQPALWRCVICGYVHEGAEPPETCPLCGACSDEFEAEDTPKPVTVEKRRSGRVIIVGGGIAGISAAETIRENSPDTEILIITKEPDFPYLRLNLTRYLAGDIGEEVLPIHPEGWYRDQRIDVLTDTEIAAILPESHEVELAGGRLEHFDKLILACGAHAFIPPIPGASLPGVYAVRTLGDVRTILRAAVPGTRCICIGGGILGLEAAGALSKRGVHVTLIESYEWLLPRQLNREAGRVLHQYVVEMGIEVRYLAKTSAISGGAQADGVVLEDGDRLSSDLILLTTGVRSNTVLARKAGLEVNQGIIVDAHLATSHPDIYAAGDAAEHRGIVYGLWEPARYQGFIAAMNCLGMATEFGGLPRANTLKVLGVDVFSIGVVTPQDGSYVVVCEASDRTYSHFLFRDNMLAGAILVGDTRLAGALVKAMKSRVDASALLTHHPSVEEVRRFFS